MSRTLVPGTLVFSRQLTNAIITGELANEEGVWRPLIGCCACAPVSIVVSYVSQPPYRSVVLILTDKTIGWCYDDDLDDKFEYGTFI